jgi:hypothetical protein
MVIDSLSLIIATTTWLMQTVVENDRLFIQTYYLVIKRQITRSAPDFSFWPWEGFIFRKNLAFKTMNEQRKFLSGSSESEMCLCIAKIGWTVVIAAYDIEI